MNELKIAVILFDLDGVLKAFNNADAKDKRIQRNPKAD